MDWKTVELLGYTYYSERGYRILIPLVSNEGYDFVAEKDGEYLRVNVKKAGLKDLSNPRSWSVSKASGANAKSTHNPEKLPVDVFLAYIPAPHNKFIVLPGDFFSGSNTKAKRIPVALLGAT